MIAKTRKKEIVQNIVLGSCFAFSIFLSPVFATVNIVDEAKYYVFNSLKLTNNYELYSDNGDVYLPNESEADYIIGFKGFHTHLFLELNNHWKDNDFVKKAFGRLYYSTENQAIDYTYGYDNMQKGFFKYSSTLRETGLNSLPQAVYRYKYVHAGFDQMVGHSAKYSYFESDFKYDLTVGFGVPKQHTDDESTLDSFNTRIWPAVTADFGYAKYYDHTFSYKDIYTLFIWHGDYYVDFDVLMPDAVKGTPLEIFNTKDMSIFKLDRIGLSAVLTQNIAVYAEYMRARSQSDISILRAKIEDDYYLIGQYATDNGYVYSLGLNWVKTFRPADISRDYFINVAKVFGKHAVGVEIHDTNGWWITQNNWQKTTRHWNTINVKWEWLIF